MSEPVTLRVNGAERRIEADPATPLLGVLRGTLGLTGTPFRLRGRTSAAPATC